MSRPTRELKSFYSYRTITVYGTPFQMFLIINFSYWPGPRSLAATSRVSVDILSSGYWDVSVHQVCFLYLCIQYKILQRSGLPHSEIHGSKGVGASPWLIAACYVLHRLSMPRHPSYALRHLIFKTCRKKIRIFIKIDILIFYYQLICWLHIYNLQKQTSYKIRKFLVGRGRLELPTSRLSSARSNQLSY